MIDGTDLHQLGNIISNLITTLLGIAGGVVIILVIIGGIRYILSSGDPKAMQAARSSITFSLIGLVIILSAVVIVLFIGNILGVSNLNIIHIGP